MTRTQATLSDRRLQVAWILGGLLLAAALVLLRLPRPVDGVGTLDQCLGGWPVVVFEGENASDVLPNDNRGVVQIPIAEWPIGMRFDESAGALLNAEGDVIFHKGDRIRIKGAVIEAHGDPSPCFYTLGIKVDQITSA